MILLVSRLQKTNGRYVIKIPESGVLKIKGHDPFGSYLATASFASGQGIWVSKRIDDKPGRGEIALWSTGTQVLSSGPPKGTFWWFVGTEQEWETTDHDARYRPGGVVKKDRQFRLNGR